MEGYCFRKNRRFSEFYLEFAERISFNDFFVFQEVEECFERCDLAFYRLWFVSLMKVCNIIF